MTRVMTRAAVIVTIGLFSASCGGGSSTPSAPSAARPGPTPSAVTLAVASAPTAFGALSAPPAVFAAASAFARCLQSSGDAACFSAARPIMRVTVAGATAPGAPSGLTATSSGSSVTLTWSAPTTGDPVVTYIIEAGSASGLANLANFPTNSTATTFSAGGVPDGTYYVRLKAQNAAGMSGASNEAVLVVGTPACSSAPNAPSGLASNVSGRTVTLSWSAPSGGCDPTSYILQAGLTSGSSALANSNIGNVTRFVATGIGNGSYYIRVVAANAFGQSAASNEIIATVALPRGAISVTVTPNPVPFSGLPIASASCQGVANTWFYDETFQETNGVAVTIRQRVSTINGQALTPVSTNFVVPASGTYAFGTHSWCENGSGPYTVQTTWSGVDANGNNISYVGPLVTLLAKPGTTGISNVTFNYTCTSRDTPFHIMTCTGTADFTLNAIPTTGSVTAIMDYGPTSSSSFHGSANASSAGPVHIANFTMTTTSACLTAYTTDFVVVDGPAVAGARVLGWKSVDVTATCR
ncbi:MAG: fibronectin type III domain-containing protein [Acidobacteria bacterium]|nr:fibronectin type III domain-containing protein [Acidobacteriota bacterium]